jgi:thiamine-phosphate pyrophosphorylase
MKTTGISGIYAITDPNLLTTPTQLLTAVDAALSEGVRIIQYRDKSASAQEKLERARAIVKLCAQYNALSIINDSIELAIASHASGVHLGQTDGCIRTAKQQLPSESIIGVTCHNNVSLALKAQAQGASYAAFGRFFPSNTKPHAKPADISCLVEAKQQLSIPVVAIGGITQHNMPQLINAGADCIAVIDSIFGSNNEDSQGTKLAASELVTAFEQFSNELYSK